MARSITQFERRHEADRVEVRALSEQKARLDQRLTVISREAGAEGDWKAAGCSSSAQWLAQITSSEYHTAAGTRRRRHCARAAAGARCGAQQRRADARSGHRRHPVRDTRNRRPSWHASVSAWRRRELARFARTLAPPTVVDDAALRKRRALSLKWIEGGRELVISGRLPLEQGDGVRGRRSAAHAKAQRALDKKHHGALEWQQSTADALVTLAARRRGSGSGSAGGVGSVTRSRTTLIVHLSADEPPFIEGARHDQPRDRRVPHLRRPPAHDQAATAATSSTRASSAAPPTPSCARCSNAPSTASTPAAAPPASYTHTTSCTSPTAG